MASCNQDTDDFKYITFTEMPPFHKGASPRLESNVARAYMHARQDLRLVRLHPLAPATPTNSLLLYSRARTHPPPPPPPHPPPQQN